MDQTYQPDGEGGYWKKLPGELSPVEVQIALESSPPPALDWSFIDGFTQFVLARGKDFADRAQGPLRFLAAQMGWFAEEAATAVFDWQAVVLPYEMSQFNRQYGKQDFLFELHFTLEAPGHAWADPYGRWVATYQGEALIGLRREQL